MNSLFQLHNDAADRSGGRRPCNSGRRSNRPRTLQRPRYQTGGRPLTPVSVSGVVLRTARRCAADVYDC
jgi:hypothetical protein